MAGSGETTTYVDSKTYHQTILDDYNNSVIVPKSLLIDTADAIRLKKNGSKEILIDDFTGDYITGGIEPVDFATEIGNITSLEFPTHRSGSSVPGATYRNGTVNAGTKTIVGYTVKNAGQYTATVADFQNWWDSVIFFGLPYCYYEGNNTNTYIALFSKDHFYYCKKHNLPWFEAGWTIYNPGNNFKVQNTSPNETTAGNIYQNVNGSPSLPFIAMSDLVNPHDAEWTWSNTISTSATPPTTHFHIYRKTTGTVGATTATTSQKNPQNWYETLQYADGIGTLHFCG